MKTKPLTLLLALVFSAPLAAADLCGGADDDQNTGPGVIVSPTGTSEPGPTPAMPGPRPILLPVGMDNDLLRRSAPSSDALPVLQDLRAAPLSLPPHQNTSAPIVQQLDRMSDDQILSLLISELHGDDDSDTLAVLLPADFLIHYLEQRHTAPAPVTGDAGDDVIRSQTRAPAGIVGGDGADFVKPVICGGNGNDSIYGEGGADSIVGGGDADFLWLRMVFGPVSSLWGGGGVDELIGCSWDTPMEVP